MKPSDYEAKYGNEGNAVSSLRSAVAVLAKFPNSTKSRIRAVVEMELDETNLSEK